MVLPASQRVQGLRAADRPPACLTVERQTFPKEMRQFCRKEGTDLRVIGTTGRKVGPVDLFEDDDFVRRLREVKGCQPERVRRRLRRLSGCPVRLERTGPGWRLAG